MNSYEFTSGAELLALCAAERIPISEAMVRRELELEKFPSRGAILAEMQKNLAVMRESVRRGLAEQQNSVTGLTGGDAELLYGCADGSLMGGPMARIVAAAMAVVEVNASMGRIVAAPTAGASGILPGVLIGCGAEQGWTDEQLISGLFTASAVGMLIAANATLAGADGGCQAETGSAAAMAAAAAVEIRGGAPERCLDAAAIALKNVMGLVCDPVAGLVECPCIKRNAIGAANALVSADLALAGVSSIIPFDETVSAMMQVGRLMSPDLRETARGGLAATPTARALMHKLGLGGKQ